MQRRFYHIFGSRPTHQSGPKEPQVRFEEVWEWNQSPGPNTSRETVLTELRRDRPGVRCRLLATVQGPPVIWSGTCT
jgi:hypothetical protein